MSEHRRVNVALAGGSPTYRSYVRTDEAATKEGRVRPLFTRATADRILRGIQGREREYYSKEPKSSRPELTTFQWDADRLVARGRAVGGATMTFAPDRDGLYALFGDDDWLEVPSWPKHPLDATSLLGLLAQPASDFVLLIDRIQAKVATDVIIEAAKQGNEHAQEILLRILADRAEPEAGSAIAEGLSSSSDGVRAEAAHALEHREDPRWGPHLLRAAQSETDPAVAELLIRAIAASHYRAALPWLESLAADREAPSRMREATTLAIRSIRDEGPETRP
jgi:hypothetical protein